MPFNIPSKPKAYYELHRIIQDAIDESSDDVSATAYIKEGRFSSEVMNHIIDELEAQNCTVTLRDPYSESDQQRLWIEFHALS